jgi:hypothetical protein
VGKSKEDMNKPIRNIKPKDSTAQKSNQAKHGCCFSESLDYFRNMMFTGFKLKPSLFFPLLQSFWNILALQCFPARADMSKLSET